MTYPNLSAPRGEELTDQIISIGESRIKIRRRKNPKPHQTDLFLWDLSAGRYFSNLYPTNKPGVLSCESAGRFYFLDSETLVAQVVSRSAYQKSKVSKFSHRKQSSQFGLYNNSQTDKICPPSVPSR